MLLSPIENAVLQETRSKRYALVPLGSGCFEMILALLTEVVTLHMRVTIVQVGIPKFEGPIRIVPSFHIWGWGCWSLGSDPFDTSPHELLEKVIVWRRSESRSGCRYRTWSGGLRARSGTRSGTPKGRSSTSDRRHNDGGAESGE